MKHPIGKFVAGTVWQDQTKIYLIVGRGKTTTKNGEASFLYGDVGNEIAVLILDIGSGSGVERASGRLHYWLFTITGRDIGNNFEHDLELG